MVDTNPSKSAPLGGAHRTLTALLRAQGVTRIKARYDGYGDSGNVEEIAVTPEAADVSAVETRLTDFVWGVAYDLHPGFENNDGGEGTLRWDVTADRIDVDHANMIMERDDYQHEDV